MNLTVRNYLLTLLVFVCFISEILCDVCSDGTVCRSGTKCCRDGCCYDDDVDDDSDDDDDRYSYGYRLSIWNMWYFWFVILFVLMSCFGGCGYYKQRHRLMRANGQASTGFLAAITVGPSRPRRRNQSSVTLSPQYNMPYSYSGPGADMGLPPEAVLTPPPYSQVVSHPDLYPVNKSELPPYPGDPVVTATTQQGHTLQETPMSTGCSTQMPSPPPYSEIANQNSPNQSHGPAAADQNAEPREQSVTQSSSQS